MGDGVPSLLVLGVYRVPVDEEELREQLRRFYFSGNIRRDTNSVIYSFVDSCIPLVLFEIQLANPDERFRIGDFTQEMPAAAEKTWQAAYEEAVLSPDGTQVVARNTRPKSWSDRILLSLFRTIHADALELRPVFEPSGAGGA